MSPEAGLVGLRGRTGPGGQAGASSDGTDADHRPDRAPRKQARSTRARRRHAPSLRQREALLWGSDDGAQRQFEAWSMHHIVAFSLTSTPARARVLEWVAEQERRCSTAPGGVLTPPPHQRAWGLHPAVMPMPAALATSAKDGWWTQSWPVARAVARRRHSRRAPPTWPQARGLGIAKGLPQVYGKTQRVSDGVFLETWSHQRPKAARIAATDDSIVCPWQWW